MGAIQSTASDCTCRHTAAPSQLTAFSRVVYGHIFGQDSNLDLVDDMVDYWIMSYPPTRRTRSIEHFHAAISVSAAFFAMSSDGSGA